jgi:hypothetical protein
MQICETLTVPGDKWGTTVWVVLMAPVAGTVLSQQHGHLHPLAKPQVYHRLVVHLQVSASVTALVTPVVM